MKCTTTTVATLFACAAALFSGVTAASPFQPVVDARELASLESFSNIQKRDAFTCHGSSNATVSDCHKVIDAVRNHGEEVFRLRSGLCLTWREGSCGARFCAVRYVQWPLNRTASWVADYLSAPLLEDCVAHSSANGVMADTLNINSNSGTYRLYLEQYPSNN